MRESNSMKKKQAYMIYSEAEGQRNRAFIEMFCKAGERYHLLFSFVPVTRYQQMPLPDLVLNRTRDPQVSRWYEKRQVRVYHDSDIVEIGNDKYKTLERLQEKLPEKELLTLQPGRNRAEGRAVDTEIGGRDGGSGIRTAKEDRKNGNGEFVSKWCPCSFLLTAEMKNDFRLLQQQMEQKLGFVDAVVLKTVDGHGGSEVYRLSADPVGDALSWRQILDRLQGRSLLCQEWVDSGSRDLRVYILWGEIYAAVLRQGQHDFRSNYSRGGSIKPYDLSERERAYIQPFIQALGGRRLTMAGIDFLVRRDGTLLFNELEEMVGCRMLYQCTERDIVQDYVMGLADCC